MRNKEYFTNLSSLDAGAVSTLNVIKMEKGFQYIGSIMKTKFVKKLAKSQQTKHRNNMQQKAVRGRRARGAGGRRRDKVKCGIVLAWPGMAWSACW